MAQADFVTQLRELGYAVTELAPGRVAFLYAVQSGKLVGHEIQLGFEVPGDFSMTPPSGPHISPRLRPNASGGSHPNGGIHDSPFGPEWHYWSRPIAHWNQSAKDVRVVMAHVRRLFEDQ